MFRLLLSFLISRVFGYALYVIIFWTLIILRYFDFSLLCLDSMWFWIMTVWIIFHFWMIGLCLVMTYNWLCPLYYIILCWLTRTLAFWCCQRGREMGWYRSLEIKIQAMYMHDILRSLISYSPYVLELMITWFLSFYTTPFLSSFGNIKKPKCVAINTRLYN